MPEHSTCCKRSDSNRELRHDLSVKPGPGPSPVAALRNRWTLRRAQFLPAQAAQNIIVGSATCLEPFAGRCWRAFEWRHRRATRFRRDRSRTLRRFSYEQRARRRLPLQVVARRRAMVTRNRRISCADTAKKCCAVLPAHALCNRPDQEQVGLFDQGGRCRVCRISLDVCSDGQTPELA